MSVWQHIWDAFGLGTFHGSLLKRFHHRLALDKSSQLRDLWFAAFVFTIWCIWYLKNQAWHEGLSIHVSYALSLLLVRSIIQIELGPVI